MHMSAVMLWARPNSTKVLPKNYLDSVLAKRGDCPLGYLQHNLMAQTIIEVDYLFGWG
jgi:hypothetical protein